MELRPVVGQVQPGLPTGNVLTLLPISRSEEVAQQTISPLVIASIPVGHEEGILAGVGFNVVGAELDQLGHQSFFE
jgi:hypothetical protein